MWQVVVNFCAAALISALVIALLLPISRRYGLLDAPDDRKQHESPTPPVGGFGVYAGIVLPLLWVNGFTPQSIGFILGGGLLVVTGALDDRYNLNWQLRILTQVLAALLMIAVSGMRANHVGPLFGFGDIELGWLSVPFSVFVTVGLINALNMFDGIDGLAGSVCFAVVCMFIAAWMYAGLATLDINLFLVLGALFGFLLFNKRFLWQKQAKAFLGDSGSGFLGFTLAYIIFNLTQDVTHPISPILGPFLLAPPIIDCLVLIVHRLRRGQSPFAAGRDHGHHLMLNAGFSVNQIVRFMVLLSCITGLLGALAMVIDVPPPTMVMFYMLALFIWFWITETPERAMRYFQWLRRKVYS